ncbi:hypothetical protein KAH27_04385 [bacterium]|nr:hypothetical protein [bacterium]
MKRSLFTLLFTTTALFLSTNLLAAPTEDEALKDWNSLQESYDGVKKELDGTVPDYAPNIIGNDYDKILAVLENYDKNTEPKLQKQLDDFSKKYGNNATEINNTIKSIVTIDWKSGKHPTTSAGETYESLKKLMANVKQAKLNKAVDFIKESEGVERTINSFDTQATRENFAKLKEELNMALKFDPDNEQAKKMLVNADTKEKEKFAAINKKIDEAKWPGNYKNFDGDSKKLSAVALEYFKNDEGWGAREKNPEHCIAVAIRGDWGSHKKNLLGQTIQWYLPVYLAVYSDNIKDKTIARVFELSLLTKEEKNVKKEPPFTGITVGNIWKIRKKNIPGWDGDTGGSGSTSKGGASSGSGFIGTIFWLGLALGNIVAGMLAAAPLLKQKLPQLNKIYEKITPLSNIIGIIVLAFGALGLLGAVLQLFLLRFVLLSNILPQLGAIAVGLFLGKQLLLKKPNLPDKASEAAEKAQELLKKYDDKIRMLEMYQIPLGLSCIIIGFLHLIISNAPLF